MENPNTWARENRNALFLHGLEDSFVYDPELPTLDADELMTKTIFRRESTESLVVKRFSQTPLLPERLVDRAVLYPRAAEDTLLLRVDDAAGKTGLRNPYIAAIQQEVTLEHNRRIKGNSEAGMRLQKEIAGQTLSEDDAMLIWKARTGDADLSETAELLLRFPSMGSIEAAKHTEPLDAKASENMRMHIQKGLFGVASQVSSPSLVKLTVYSHHDDRHDLRPMNMSIDIEDEYARELQGFMRGSKENLAEVQRGGVKIQLVYKRTKIVIHPDLHLENTVKNEVYENGHKVNLQDIGFACYWRVIESAQ